MSYDVTETSQTVAAGQLRAFVERIERIEADIKDLNGDKSDVYKELRGFGFDVKAVRQVVAARKLDTAEREERTAMFDLYWEALIGGSRVHVHEDRSDNGADITMRHTGIATDLPPHDRETGEITEESDDDAFAAVTVTDQLADAMGVEPSPSEPNSVHVGDECPEQPEDGLSASGDHSEIDHSAASSQVADTAAGEIDPSSPAAFSSPASRSPQVDDGHPDQSSDEVPSEQGGVKPGPLYGQSGQQTASAAQDRNEPVSVSGASATISEADVPDFLKRKEGCLDQAGCKVKTYSILCARCAAERVRARAA